MLPIVEIIRLEENYEHGTFGILRLNKQVFCYTLEENDELNTANISSIPAQQYICELRATGLNSVVKLGLYKTYEVLNVPDRTGIKFHPGNSDDDTEGCILLGEKIGKLRTDRTILNSGVTYLNFMNCLAGESRFHLTVMEHY